MLESCPSTERPWAPGMGGTGAAKESLGFIAIPGSSLCMIGLGITIYVLVTKVMMRRNA